MKTITKNLMSLFILLLLILSMNVYAQDPLKAAPNAYKKVLLENERVRIMQVEITPGETIPWHHHPDHTIYALADGKIEITDKGKAPVIIDIKAGDAMYIPAVTHMAKNLGDTTVSLIVTEIKPKAKK
ncbi:MAG: cupin domain-containing protein [Flavobacterium nitrogenifigens]|uniref:Mannose-6-phosphate isomerase, cupin superfamily n=1 Tax=Flavobacterium nitrogenifigens TaxID=1617283 RepID=A0A521EEJ7_9FLAO|nr:cupin domain-containing protein [Flavobacterium nitrogenifigens]KAF2325982.1 cupin domain-containing protein [Flavobacterium nitrogenifigens]MDQ8014111.1 cupin domain-containing protein [Flavobacterium nitrogenifigens]SMO82343.1 Mannose-6-phosphate isomerase, cupin superfamily [Flavobacterium nitrogenifigens]